MWASNHHAVHLKAFSVNTHTRHTTHTQLPGWSEVQVMAKHWRPPLPSGKRPQHPSTPCFLLSPGLSCLPGSSLQHLTAPPSPGPLRTQPRGRLKPPSPSLLCRSAGLWAGGIGGIQTNGPPDSDLPSCFFTSRGLGQGLGAAGLGRVDTSWQCFLLLLFLKLHTSLENNVAG